MEVYLHDFTKVYHFLVYFSILFFTLAAIIVNYLLRIILNIGFINIKRKHLYSINRPGRLLEGGAYFQHFEIRWALIRGGRLKEGGHLIEEIRYLTSSNLILCWIKYYLQDLVYIYSKQIKICLKRIFLAIPLLRYCRYYSRIVPKFWTFGRPRSHYFLCAGLHWTYNNDSQETLLHRNFILINLTLLLVLLLNYLFMSVSLQ